MTLLSHIHVYCSVCIDIFLLQNVANACLGEDAECFDCSQFRYTQPGLDLFTKEDQASAIFFPAARALVSILILDGIPCARSKSWLIVRARSTLIALQTQDALGLDQPLQEELASAIPEQPMWS